MTPAAREDLLRIVQELQRLRAEMYQRLNEASVVLEWIYNAEGAEQTPPQETG